MQSRGQAHGPDRAGPADSSSHAPADWPADRSMDVKFEGKNVQLLGDAMTNNE